MVISMVNGMFYIITPGYMFRPSLFEPSSGWSIKILHPEDGSNNESRNMYYNVILYYNTWAWRWLKQREPKHVAGKDNVKYTINPNINH